jgi:hypothetical protein
MNSTKLMLLGILLMLLGIGLGTSIVPALFSTSSGSGVLSILKFIPGIEAFFIVIGLIIGIIGFTQKERKI